MPESIIEKFKKERHDLAENMLKHSGINTKRLLNVDSQVYSAGALSPKIKELLGLATSTVLRCDDCIMYHLIRCHEEKVTEEELEEALAIAFTVGGSITIPHIRRAWRAWDQMPGAK